MSINHTSFMDSRMVFPLISKALIKHLMQITLTPSKNYHISSNKNWNRNWSLAESRALSSNHLFQISSLHPLPSGKNPPRVNTGCYIIFHFHDNNSVNYNIDKTFTTVKYQTLQDAIALIQEHFPSVYLAKSDIADAFRIIPISPTQYHLLGFQFEGKYYYEKMLSMGAAPSCQIFEVFSSSLQWILKTRYNITCIKVLDDFLFVQPS